LEMSVIELNNCQTKWKKKKTKEQRN
jgi:hypothetical protein